jgi:hypothetical protein
MLFTGVAYSITAFPVLCRILVELQLLDTTVGKYSSLLSCSLLIGTVGVVVLSAGVANDVVGWVLLALAIGLVNGGGGLQALYILLVCVGFTIALLTVGRRAIHWLARSTGSIEHGPTVFFMTVVILTLFGAAFFTDVIGVNAIFGVYRFMFVIRTPQTDAVHSKVPSLYATTLPHKYWEADCVCRLVLSCPVTIILHYQSLRSWKTWFRSYSYLWLVNHSHHSLNADDVSSTSHSPGYQRVS